MQQHQGGFSPQDEEEDSTQLGNVNVVASPSETQGQVSFSYAPSGRLVRTIHDGDTNHQNQQQQQEEDQQEENSSRKQHEGGDEQEPNRHHHQQNPFLTVSKKKTVRFIGDDDESSNNMNSKNNINNNTSFGSLSSSSSSSFSSSETTRLTQDPSPRHRPNIVIANDNHDNHNHENSSFSSTTAITTTVMSSTSRVARSAIDGADESFTDDDDDDDDEEEPESPGTTAVEDRRSADEIVQSDGVDNLASIVPPEDMKICYWRFKMRTISIISLICVFLLTFITSTIEINLEDACLAVSEGGKGQCGLRRLSIFLGWSATYCWVASFIPQIVINYRRKSVVGMSLDFAFSNFLGYSCYSLLTAAFFFSSEVKLEYRARFHSVNNVRLNDVFFALGGAICCGVLVWQCFIYERGGQKPARVTIWSIWGCMIILTIWSVLLFVFKLRADVILEPLDLLYFLGVVKIIVTLLKYYPQVYLSYTRKSTVGVSISNWLLDLAGGTQSLTQEIMDAAISGNWIGLLGNIVKLGLASITIVYDFILIAQHFCLYSSNNKRLIQAFKRRKAELRMSAEMAEVPSSEMNATSTSSSSTSAVTSAASSSSPSAVPSTSMVS